MAGFAVTRIAIRNFARQLPIVFVLAVLCALTMVQVGKLLSPALLSNSLSTRKGNGIPEIQIPHQSDIPMSPALELQQRPLFERSRRPPRQPDQPPVIAVREPVAMQQVTIKPAPPPAPTILGIVASPDRQLVVLRHPSDAKVVYAELGATIGGWTLVDIGVDRVMLKWADERRELIVFPRNKTATTQATPNSVANVRQQSIPMVKQ